MTSKGEELLKEVDKLNQSEGIVGDKEPALKVGSSITVVTGLASLVAALWPDLIPESKLTTVLVILVFLLPIVTAIFTRGKVWSPASVQEVLDEAVSRALETQRSDQAKMKKDKPDPPRILGNGI